MQEEIDFLSCFLDPLCDSTYQGVGFAHEGLCAVREAAAAEFDLLCRAVVDLPPFKSEEELISEHCPAPALSRPTSAIFLDVGIA